MAVRQRLVAGRYRLRGPVGAGGMGRVWLARDEMLHRDVAIKEIVPPEWMTEDEQVRLRQRTLREARSAARLNHPNVVRIYDVVYADGLSWIVMEYVQSRSLQQVLLEDGPYEPAVAARIGLAVLDALAAAHRAGVLHRDVKPHNVLIGTDGRVVLTDFGLATFVDDGTVTAPGLIVGSPQYVSPERGLDGASTVESDLWSLGATLYAAVEGQSPYARETAMATLTALATEPPDPPVRAGPLAPILGGLLQYEPADRLTAPEVERLLRRIVVADPREIPLLPTQRTRRRPPPAKPTGSRSQASGSPSPYQGEPSGGSGGASEQGHHPEPRKPGTSAPAPVTRGTVAESVVRATAAEAAARNAAADTRAAETARGTSAPNATRAGSSPDGPEPTPPPAADPGRAAPSRRRKAIPTDPPSRPIPSPPVPRSPVQSLPVPSQSVPATPDSETPAARITGASSRHSEAATTADQRTESPATESRQTGSADPENQRPDATSEQDPQGHTPSANRPSRNAATENGPARLIMATASAGFRPSPADGQPTEPAEPAEPAASAQTSTDMAPTATGTGTKGDVPADSSRGDVLADPARADEPEVEIIRPPGQELVLARPEPGPVIAGRIVRPSRLSRLAEVRIRVTQARLVATGLVVLLLGGSLLAGYVTELNEPSPQVFLPAPSSTSASLRVTAPETAGSIGPGPGGPVGSPGMTSPRPGSPQTPGSPRPAGSPQPPVGLPGMPAETDPVTPPGTAPSEPGPPVEKPSDAGLPAVKPTGEATPGPAQTGTTTLGARPPEATRQGTSGASGKEASPAGPSETTTSRAAAYSPVRCDATPPAGLPRTPQRGAARGVKGLSLQSGWSYFNDGSGFHIAVPDGWTYQRIGGTYCFRSPRTARVMSLDTGWDPAADPLAASRAEERRVARSGNPRGYSLIGIGPVPLLNKATDWEFRYRSRAGAPRQAGVRWFVTNGRAYTLGWSTPAKNWKPDLVKLQMIRVTFYTTRTTSNP